MKKIVFVNDIFAFENWLNKQNIILDNIEKYDFSKSKNNFDDMLESIISIDMFSSFKVIIINDLDKIIAKIDDNQQQILINYDSDDKFIVYCFNEKVDNRLKWYKNLAKDVEIINLNNDSINFEQKIIDFCNEQHIVIDKLALNYFKENIKDYNHFNQVTAKLLLYEQAIDLDLAKLCLLDNSEINFLDLSQYIIDLDLNKIFTSINYLYKNKQEYYGVIYLVIKKIITLFQLLLLQKSGYNQNDICKQLNISDKYYWFLSNKMSKNFNLNKCMKWIKVTRDIDYLVKTGALDKKLAFEKWMLSLGVYGKS